MVPFFGSHVTQQTVNLDSTEGRLDNLQVFGRFLFHLERKNRQSLFAPQKNMGWAHGSLILSDFMQSRVNPANEDVKRETVV